MSEIPEFKETVPHSQTMEELGRFLDVPIKVRIELGNRSMKVRDILQLQPKSIVQLPKSAGENLDILMNERLIAFGEVVEMEGSTGIRLADFNVSR